MKIHNVKKVLDAFITKEEEKEREWLAKVKEQTEQTNKLLGDRSVIIRNCLVKARPLDYRRWLKGYIENGGEPTHSYSYLLPSDCWYEAHKDFHLGVFCGSTAIHVIVPREIAFTGGAIGHCNLFFMKDYSHLGFWVPVYTDTRF